MYDAVGILIPKLYLRNSELFPSYNEAWMLQKQWERNQIFELDDLSSPFQLKLSYDYQ